MAKKKKETKAKAKTTPWTNSFKEMADKINDGRRGNVVEKEVKVAKIPKATLFVDGKKIILNG